MTAHCSQIAAPMIDGRTREAQMLAEVRRELEQRLGPSPSFEARQLAEQILRTRLDIALLERQRADGEALSDFDREMLGRHENALSRALRRLERLCPLPKPREPSLAEQLAAERRAREAQPEAA